jgi:hypothetical protein
MPQAGYGAQPIMNGRVVGRLAAGLGGVALIVVMSALDWYYDYLNSLFASLPESLNAWQAFEFTDVVLLATALVGFGLAVSPEPSERATAFTLVVGSAAGGWLLLRIVDQPGPNLVVDVKLGAWLGLIATLAIAAGAWLMREPTRT